MLTGNKIYIYIYKVSDLFKILIPLSSQTSTFIYPPLLSSGPVQHRNLGEQKGDLFQGHPQQSRLGLG